MPWWSDNVTHVKMTILSPVIGIKLQTAQELPPKMNVFKLYADNFLMMLILGLCQKRHT